ncbi:hypothetical protein DFJ58DRAFT_843473 [Suillus subalutaceus]|uniref:uncharacterized protein n=1 Tax=Suillus subalutaceus TaxID=48586 RepID=UPI001B875CDE|nr:uncharacterized protein DFJ58DRAFT_843473 [Suillus subalutaceus]KAG1846394.1 hypothetical protein DFJ58DRAFT_843473 [Suillus subalutaceus]
MPHTSVPVPAFYQEDGPPQPLLLLTYHTEMLYPRASFVLISSQEEMAFSTHKPHRHIHTPLRNFTTPLTSSHAPTPKVTKSVSFLTDQIPQKGEPEQISMYSSILSTDSNESKIPKPEGEMGRPGRGGYNLERALNWDTNHFKKLREYVHRSINNHCDTSKSRTNQTPAALSSVEREAVAHFPELHDYMGCWPVEDLIQMQLQNISTKERQKQAKKIVIILQDVLLNGFVPPHPDEVPTDSVVESYPLQELHPMHTYPPTPQPTATSAPSSTYPLEPTSLSEDFMMTLYNPWGAGRRMREEEDQRHTKVLLKEIDQSSGLRDDMHALRYSHHELLMEAHSRELEMQSVIGQYRDKNVYLEHEKVQALTSLEQQHCNEVTAIQNQLALNFEEAQHATRVERDSLLAEKDASCQHEILVAREKQLTENEREVARLTAEYGCKIASLNVHLRSVGLKSSDNCVESNSTGKHCYTSITSFMASSYRQKPVATCTNILGFSPIPDICSESLADEEPQTSSSGDAGCPLNSLVANVLIENVTVGMLAEVLAKANVRDLFKEAFHLTKDDEYMLYEGASREAISLFIGGMGPGPDPLALQWDMMTTHKSDWNQEVIDLLYSLYMTMQERNHWTGRSQQSIRRDIAQKFDQCRRYWRKARPQVLSDGTHETMQQVGDRLVDHTNEQLRMAIVLSHRTTKFETRQKVTSALLSDRKATGKEDLPIWVYLNSIVETLDKDDMSSDESDTEDCEILVFQLKTMTWRANFSHEMQIIDEQRLAGAAVFTPRGSKPAKRLHNAKWESVWPAVADLPRAFYNPLWLSNQRLSFKLLHLVL